MDKLITPIAMTTVNWPEYTTLCRNILKIDPESILKSIGIKTDNPAAFLATLSLDKNPRENITESIRNNTHDHVSVSFLTIINKQSTLTDFVQLPLKLIKKYIADEDFFLSVITGNMNDWHDAVIYSLVTDKYQRETRIIMCGVMIQLERLGFRSIWAQWEKYDLNMQLFKLRKKV